MAVVSGEDFEAYTTAQLAVRITHLRGVIAQCGNDKVSAATIGAAVDRAVKIFNDRPDCGGVMLAPPVGAPAFGLTAEAGAVCDWFGLERAQIEGSLPGDVIEAVDVLEWRKARAMAKPKVNVADEIEVDYVGGEPEDATEATPDAEDAPGTIDEPETAPEVEDTSPPTTGTSVTPGPASPHDGAHLDAPEVTWHAQQEMDKLGMTVEHMEAVLGELPDKITKAVVAEVVANLAEGGAV